MQTVNLILDTGNTFHKIAVMDINNTVLEERIMANLTAEVVEELVARYAPSRAIVSSTRGDAARSVAMLEAKVPYVLCLCAETPLPIEVDYARETLGSDRVAAVVGAVAEYGADRRMLIVDRGTAITFDVVDCGRFVGGNISPGVDMRMESLHEKTATLPLCSPKLLGAAPSELGRSTVEAIENGVMEGVFYEVKGYIDTFCKENDDILIIFIGGDAEYFVNRIKNAIFASRNLMYSGLNRILEYNAAKKK
jgi:type III pantothenate kinase